MRADIASLTCLAEFGGVISRNQMAGARAMLGWKQEDLAEKAGVSVSTVKDFEAGRRQPRTPSLEKIQKAIEQAGIAPIDPDRWGGEGVRFVR